MLSYSLPPCISLTLFRPHWVRLTHHKGPGRLSARIPIDGGLPCQASLLAVVVLLGLAFGTTACSAQGYSAQGHSAQGQAKFVEALRQRGWYDTALEYLNDFAADDPLMTDDFRHLLPYEQGRTLAEQAKHATNIRRRVQWQQQAVQRLLEFAKAQPQMSVTLDALSQAGNLLAAQGLHAIAEFQKLPKQAAAERDRLRADTLRLLDEAATVMEDLKQACNERLAALPKPAMAGRDTSIARQRTHLRSRLAEARFLLAKLAFDKAQVQEEGSPPFQEMLTDAAQRFAQLAKDNAENLIGFYGRLYEGRCYQAMGDTKRALASYEELVYQPIQDPVFRRLVARAYRRRAECFLREENYDQAMVECQGWLDQSRPKELDRQEWLVLKYQLAMVLLKKSESLPKPDTQLKATARRLLTDVSQKTGEFQQPARATLATLTGSSAREGQSDQVVIHVEDIKNFTAAVTAGKEAMQRMNSSKLAARLAKENNPEAVESLQQQAEVARLHARRLFVRALELADPKIEYEQLNTVRYHLCWLNWEDGRLQEAALLGEFLARYYPESQYTPIAAKVALAAYQRLYNQSRASSRETAEENGPVDDSRYEVQRLAALAELVVQRWPDSQEATVASQLLINMAVHDQRLEEAEALLERLPELNRAASQVSLGSALWASYLQALQTTSGELDPLVFQRRERAETFLRQGLQGVSSVGQLTPAQARGALILAQLLLNRGDARQAIEVLEDSRIGPLVSLRTGGSSQTGTTAGQQESPAGGFTEETYKTALRAYVSVTPPRREQALAMMDALEQVVAHGDDEAAKRQLTRVYVSLGLQLQKQVQQLTASGQSEEAGRVAAAFEDFLQRVGERADADDWSVQLWIAQTSQQLGAGLTAGDGFSRYESPSDGSSGELPSEDRPQDAARLYFKRAEKAYQSLLEKAANDPNFAPSPVALLGVKKRLSDCQCRMGKYADAIEGYADILRQKPNMLELQRAAAMAFQQWGVEDQQIEAINQAIRGAMPQANQKNLIWGWLRLASIADYAIRKVEVRGKAEAKDKTPQAGNSQMPQPQTEAKQKIVRYQNLFFEARYQAIQARFQGALFSQGAARKKYLGTARQSILSMVQLYPELGGDSWKEKFTQLQADIEAEK